MDCDPLGFHTTVLTSTVYVAPFAEMARFLQPAAIYIFNALNTKYGDIATDGLTE